jgi:hypothetical protein
MDRDLSARFDLTPANNTCARCSGNPKLTCTCTERCGFAGCGAKLPVADSGFGGFSRPAPTAPVKRNLVPVGTMRGWLQPVRMATLAGPVTDVYGAEHFAEGDTVTMQFWGGGVTYVTKAWTNEFAAARTNTVRIYEPSAGEQHNGEYGDA